MGQDSSLGKRVVSAAKWSVAAQVIAKLVSPVTTMVLARLLTPSAFGIVATATMVTSLAEMISDAGFQKYLIQHKFDSESDESLSACVAFWANLFIAVMLAAAIIAFNEELSVLVGNPGLGFVLVISALAVPLTSLISVQTALYQKHLDFKTLFGSRVGSSVTVLIVSVSLALAGFSFWSMIMGNIAGSCVLALWLTAKSKWKPRLLFDFSQLKGMLSYGVWVLFESVATWVNTWAGTFVIGTLMDSWSVGLYKTSMSVSASVVGIFTAALLPVIFSSLSKLQNDDSAFEKAFLKMQRWLSILLIPIAVGAFVYRHAFVLIVLGSQWTETEMFIGLWVLSSCIVVVFGYMCSEAYRAKGKPQFCVVVQVVYLVPFLPALYFSALHGYGWVSLVMPATRLLLVVINLVVMKCTIGVSPLKMIRATGVIYVQSLIAMVPGIIVTSLTDSIWCALGAFFLSVVIYVILLVLARETRMTLLELLDRLGLKSAKSLLTRINC